MAYCLNPLDQAPLIIYMPVWVDEFAPPESAAVWMALLQASVAMGIMFGYVTAGLIVTYVGEEVCPLLSCDADDLDCHHDLTHGGHEGCHNPRWRIPLYIQVRSAITPCSTAQCGAGTPVVKLSLSVRRPLVCLPLRLSSCSPRADISMQGADRKAAFKPGQ